MSIQIISTFNATGQVAYVRDEKHGEMLMSGATEDIVDSIAELAVQFSKKYAIEACKDKGIEENDPKSEDHSITNLDNEMLSISHVIVQAIQSKLIKEKVKHDFDSFPESLKSVIANGLTEMFYKMVEDEGADEDE